MEEKIETYLGELIEGEKRRVVDHKGWEKISGLNIVGSEYPIVYLLMKVMALKMEGLEMVDLQSFQRFLKILSRNHSSNYSLNFISALSEIYKKIRGNN